MIAFQVRAGGNPHTHTLIRSLQSMAAIQMRRRPRKIRKFVKQRHFELDHHGWIIDVTERAIQSANFHKPIHTRNERGRGRAFVCVGVCGCVANIAAR